MSSMPKINPTKTQAWADLQAHYDKMKHVHMRDLFKNEPHRAKDFSIALGELFLDYSKNRISDRTVALLLQLAEEVKLKEAIDGQFSGEKINETENRAVLHTALRDFKNMLPEVKDCHKKMESFSQEILEKTYVGHTGKPIDTIVNIGIGGSHLGPEMVCTALQNYNQGINVHFVSNIDGDSVHRTLQKINPETTLFIIVSKSFTTQETLTNANTVRQWLVQKSGEDALKSHFVAVSANTEEVLKFGIAKENIFPMWDWVGGRFSLWSAVGLAICCAVGYSNFEKLLKGAHKMDTHFQQANFKENIPVLLALISVWYNNFFNCESEAVVPYAEALQKLVPYLQQAIMESNGKEMDRNQQPIDYQTGTLVWGAAGTNAQHAFFQLLHQGTKLVPVDFICFKESSHKKTEHDKILFANCIAQSEALMQGKEDLKNVFRNFKGNKPSNTVLIKKLTPENLGSLVAMYEHKIFVQGIVWNIFSYDQWGVELGKVLASKILNSKIETLPLSTSSKELMNRF